MDIAGADVLRQRIAQQENWRQSVAVRAGHQPAIDPDGHVLESFCDGVRNYRDEHRIELCGGRAEMVTRRISKQLVDGAWHVDVVVERVPQYA